ncbi:MAG TPA: multiheme c-type cytochrome [Ignavibacteria bacterium]
MKTNQKKVVLVLSIVLSLFIIIDSVQSNQTNAIREKSDLLLPVEISRFVQENPKYNYIGIEKCASVCHNKDEMGFQYNIMKNGPHSQAYKILTSKQARKYAKNVKVKVDPEESMVCLKCHVTGGGLDSSFFAVTYRKDEGVTCEACHKGPYITKAFLPTEIDCLKCHNDSVHKISEFDFKDKSAKIAHPRPKSGMKKI